MNTISSSRKDERRVETLLIEEAPELRVAISEYLRERGIETIAASLENQEPSLLKKMNMPVTILDVDVQKGDGFALIETVISRRSRCLVLSRRIEVSDRIRALSMGAYAFMAKPLDYEELYLRLRNMLSNAHSVNGRTCRPVADLNGVKVDLLSRKLLRKDEATGVDLTETEFHMLRVLAENMGQVVGREALFTPSREGTYAPLTRALDVGVSRLRGKLKSINAGLTLRSVRHAGYLLMKISKE